MEQMKIAVVVICCVLMLLALVAVMATDAHAVEPIAPEVCTEGLWHPAAEKPLRGGTVSVDKNDAYILAQMAWGEARGCSDMEIAATMWCVCNRCDAWGLSIVEAVAAPGQFAGWSSGNPLDDHIYKLAIDVLTRWELEKAGQADVGRVLPAAYLWFTGDGKHNAFRDAYQGGNVWDWSLPNVYGEAGK